VTATGRIILAATDRDAIKPEQVTIGASPVDFDGNPGPQRPGKPKSDWAFDFGTWPGAGKIRLTLPEGWSVQYVRLNGADVTGKPIEFVAGTRVSGLEVAIAR
jgi:hypothetical protein